MFNMFKTLVAKPTPTAIAVEDIDRDAAPSGYFEHADRLGLRGVVKTLSRQAERANFCKFLAENGICVYDRDAVIKYLNSIRPRGHKIVWRSLTDSDALDENFRRSPYHTFYEPYGQLVPTPVLMTIEKIMDAFPDAGFLVSSFDMPKEDPFLAVLYVGEAWIVERWDEPGFRQ